MSIRASAAKQVDALISSLASPDRSVRDAAVARLVIIGPRAVDRLIALVRSGREPSARAAGFQALEAIGDPRALEPALRAMSDDEAVVAGAAAGVARAFVPEAAGAKAVEGLTLLALDRARADSVRVTAIRALRELDGRTVGPLLKILKRDPSALVRAETESAGRAKTGGGRRQPADDAAGELGRMAEQELPHDPLEVIVAVAHGGGHASLSALLRLIERTRDRQAAAPVTRRSNWMAARGSAHLALALRGSRIALYDLREWLESSSAPLPADALAALSRLGDRSCLEPIAVAHGRASDASWRRQLLEAFQTIARREKVTARSAVLTRIRRRWPGAFQ